MKIAFFTYNYLDQTGGIQNSIHRFKQGLETLGHEVAIFTDDRPGVVSEKSSQIHILPAISLPKFTKKFPDIRIPLTSAPADLLQFKPDIIHSHTHSPLGYLAYWCGKKFNTPFIYTYHTALHKVSQYFISERYGIKIAEQLAFKLASLADYVIAPGLPTKTYLLKNSISTPITVVSTGVDIAKYKRRHTDMRPKLGLKPSDIVLLNVERMREDKRQDFILRAFAEFVQKHAHSNVNLVIAGEGPYKNHLKELSRKLGVDKETIFLGILDEPDLIGLYQSADIFLIASLSETQGLVPLEAAAAGLPIVAVHDKTLAYCVRDQENGIFVKDNDEAMAKAIFDLVEDPHKKLEFGKRSLVVAAMFSLSAQAKKMLEVYKKVFK